MQAGGLGTEVVLIVHVLIPPACRGRNGRLEKDRQPVGGDEQSHGGHPATYFRGRV